MMNLDLIATSTFGLEAVVVRELAALGHESRIPQTGRIEFAGDDTAVAKTNLWLRSADRILIRIGRFQANDFDQLFDGIQALPWEQWIPADGCFPVSGRSVKSTLTSVPAVQRSAKKAIVTRLLEAHQVSELSESGAKVPVEVALLENTATLTIDTSGTGLHKRGYRDLIGTAPLRETLAAALVQLSFWDPDRPLLDPFCGSGTICIEAAMIARNIAPGLKRQFTAETWPAIDTKVWQQARDEAKAAIGDDLPNPIIASDIDTDALTMAQRHAIRAGVADSIKFQKVPFSELSSSRRHGCLVTNPPYGERIDGLQEVKDLYHSMPLILRRLPTWSFFILTSWNDFERLADRRADRRRKLYNGSIQCTYYQFHGPRPVSDPDVNIDKPADQDIPDATPQVFGGLGDKAKGQADIFANRLRKMDRHRRRWPTRRGITCYRIYNRDIPEIPLMVDRYEDCLHIGEYQRPHDRSIAEHADWLDLMVQTAGLVLDVPHERIFVKHRQPQRGRSQYDRVSENALRRIVTEGGLRFEVNLSDYIDTGLFLDHRITRDLIRCESSGKDVLNLFAYTGSFSVYAAAGGARRITSVDLSRTYLDWARHNVKLNNQPTDQHEFVRANAVDFVKGRQKRREYDLTIIDAPTFSNSKRTEEDWDIQRHHGQLVQDVSRIMKPGGIIFFATNYRRFKLDEEVQADMNAQEITHRTVPEDFANKKTHRCWRIQVREQQHPSCNADKLRS